MSEENKKLNNNEEAEASEAEITETESEAEVLETEAETEASETESETEEKTVEKPKAGKRNYRKLKHGGFSAALTAVFIAAAVMLNVVFGLFVNRLNIRFDLSDGRLYSIEASTAEFLSSLDDTLNFYFCSEEEYFTGRGQVYVQVHEIAKRFAEANRNINISFVNRLTNPSFSDKYGGALTDSDIVIESEKTGLFQIVRESDYVVAEYFINGERVNEQMAREAVILGYQELVAMDISAGTEQAFLTAVIKITDLTPVRIAFSNAFGENGHEAMSELLARNGYIIEEIDLMTNAVIDPELDFLVIFSPSLDFTANACTAVNNWLDNGGMYGKNLLYFASLDTLETPNLEALLRDWGLWVEPGFIVQENPAYYFQTDESGFTQYVRATGEAFADGILDRSLVSLISRPVWMLESNTIVYSTAPLIETYEGSWVYVPPAEGEESAFEPSFELLCVAAMSTKTRYDGMDAITSRFIAFGSPALFVGTVLEAQHFTNSLLLLNIMGDLSGRNQATARVMPKSFITRFDITSGQANGIAIVFVAVLPLIIITTGLVVFFRRRYR